MNSKAVFFYRSNALAFGKIEISSQVSGSIKFFDEPMKSHYLRRFYLCVLLI
ncbi:unnamed protein product [Allacma fusca]|uniref:Uncharacterized protein n=1 Tax=Allacma fusca TaxID=39272 RepID=A0A8J2JQ91_9HEXA|nr:unnamed protein product [Allacma fusca]